MDRVERLEQQLTESQAEANHWHGVAQRVVFVISAVVTGAVFGIWMIGQAIKTAIDLIAG